MNNWLRIRTGTILTPVMQQVIDAFEPHFRDSQHIAYVTSGKRSPEDQLNIIKKYAHLNSVDIEFPNIMTAKLNEQITFVHQMRYSWQPAWSRLLQNGIMINPPLDATNLFAYEHPIKGHIMIGTMIKASEHFCTGDVHPFDVGGSTNSIRDELVIVKEIFDEGKIKEFIGYLAEHGNNSIHCRCKELKSDESGLELT